MEIFDRKKHWENIYQTKQLNEVSWHQPNPETSVSFFTKLNIPKEAAIIDVGGGDSFLADNLLNMGYQNITVLDISEAAIQRARQRLGSEADRIKWVVSDILDFAPSECFDVWHDRAAFHFLTTQTEIEKYREIVAQNLKSGGIMVLGTFSDKGPKKCSGIDICQYTDEKLHKLFERSFNKIECFYENHQTPFSTLQNFVFCSFEKK